MPGVTPTKIRAQAAQTAARAWRAVSWRSGTQAPWWARFWACRVSSAHDWRTRHVAPAGWLRYQRERGPTPKIKYYFVHLPVTASLKAFFRLAYQRWATE